ncbi:MAG: nitrophenyl compound nitroreductase subunit ArsF family protein [Thermoguttaceae bacterium]
MDMKNAFAVCLISLFSATLVVLIARSLESQAAARLEPQLASIVEELRALRTQGGTAATPDASSKAETISDGLIVYYFHGNIRCPTCQSIESQSHEAVKKYFAPQLASGKIVWKILNYEQPMAKPLATKFDIQMPVVVLAQIKDGQVKDWKRLDEVWAIEGDKPAFAKFVRSQIQRMLVPEEQTSPPAAKKSELAIPLPDAKNARAKETPAIPIPNK